MVVWNAFFIVDNPRFARVLTQDPRGLCPSITMEVAGIWCSTSIVRSMTGARVLTSNFLVADFLTWGVQITHFFCGLGNGVMEGAWATPTGCVIERGGIIMGNNIVES